MVWVAQGAAAAQLEALLGVRGAGSPRWHAEPEVDARTSITPLQALALVHAMLTAVVLVCGWQQIESRGGTGPTPVPSISAVVTSARRDVGCRSAPAQYGAGRVATMTSGADHV
jgi:hypothetical protein